MGKLKLITDKEFFERVLELTSDSDMVAKANHKLEVLSKKNSKVDIAKLEEDTRLKNIIYNTLLENARPMRIMEIAKGDLNTADLTASKIRYLLGLLINEGKVERTEESRLSYFKALV